jgi:DNA (cytosine-5)-methyltransferase 1
MLTHASLFSGIGGFDLAAEWAGWENIFHCEWNPFGQKVLAHHFPNSKSYNDITKTNFSIHEGTIDVLTGGFPCQPYSVAGKRLGKADERHLFPEMLRAIKEIKPRWIIGENVRGLVSWNGGLVFDEVCADLESQGYEVQSFLIPAASVNAPHKRDRIWFVAYSNHKGRRSEFNDVSKENGEVPEWNQDTEFSDSNVKYDSFNSNSNGNRNIEKSNTKKNGISKVDRQTICSWQSFGTNSINATNSNNEGRKRNGKQSVAKRQITFGSGFRGWDNFPTEPSLCGRNDGISKGLDGITFSKWRQESIKAYGNAIVPQVALQIFKAINEFELLVNK